MSSEQFKLQKLQNSCKMKWKRIKILTDSPGPSLGQAGSVVGCPSPVYSTRKSGRVVPLRSDGAIWERNDWPSTFTVDRLTPAMSIMVGARSMFSTGAWTSREKNEHQWQILFWYARRTKRVCVCVCVCVSVCVSATCSVCFGLIPGPRTRSGTLMSNSYSCLLSMGSENWPGTARRGGYRQEVHRV